MRFKFFQSQGSATQLQTRDIGIFAQLNGVYSERQLAKVAICHSRQAPHLAQSPFSIIWRFLDLLALFPALTVGPRRHSHDGGKMLGHSAVIKEAHLQRDLSDTQMTLHKKFTGL